MPRSAELLPPPSSTYRSLVSSGFGILISVPLSIWVNLITATPFVDIITLLNSKNSFALLAAIALVALNLWLVRRWDVKEREWVRVTGMVRAQHVLTVQKKILDTYCDLLREILGCPVSARLFEAKLEEGRYHLFQVRDVFIENEFFPQEAAYTSVPEDNPAFVHNLAFKTRAPVYELLEVNHTDRYSDRERPMVEPQQRWVLAAPVQNYDPSGRARDDRRPRGVVVFYGRSDPVADAAPGSLRGERARAVSRDAAEAFVYMSIGTSPPVTDF